MTVWFRSIIPVEYRTVNAVVPVQVWSKPPLIIELQPIKYFTCDRCNGRSLTVKCAYCYPSPAFPLKRIEYKGHTYGDWKKFDRWYTWMYLTEFVEDPEERYEIHLYE